MKKLIFTLFLIVFASSAYAGTIYKWVDEAGVVNFVDDYGKIPPVYRDRVEEINTPRIQTSAPSQTPSGKARVSSGEMVRQAPPIEQALIREGDFAIKLAETLKIGHAQSEAEAESMLASAGITPQNGWIADYPVTPDIIGELQNSIGAACDSGRLAVKKDEAIKAFQDLGSQQGLTVKADERRYADVEPSPGDYGEYSRPEIINNYYDNQGPPVVTYYPPPWNYDYLYSWVPYPFWSSGFWFPGFFCLRDFHRTDLSHGKRKTVSNHFMDHKTRGVVSIDPATRGTGRPHHTSADASQRGGFTSPEARRGAASIFEQSHERAGLGSSVPSGVRGGPSRQIPPNRSGNISAPRGQIATVRPPTMGHWSGRSQAGVVPRNMGNRSFGHQGGFGNTGMTAPRSSVPSRGGGSFKGPQGSGGSGSRGSFGGLRGGH